MEVLRSLSIEEVQKFGTLNSGVKVCAVTAGRELFNRALSLASLLSCSLHWQSSC